MSLRSLAVRTSNFTAAQACVEIIAGANPFRLVQIDYSSTDATPQVIGLGRPALAGVTPTAPVTMLSDALGDTASTTKVALAWGTSPTVPAAFIRRAAIAAAIGASFQWYLATAAFSWKPGSQGILVPANTTIVLWNIVTSVASDVNIVIDE